MFKNECRHECVAIHFLLYTAITLNECMVFLGRVFASGIRFLMREMVLFMLSNPYITVAENAAEQAGDAAQANNPLADMVALNMCRASRIDVSIRGRDLK